MFRLAQPFLFLLPPETAHHIAFGVLRWRTFRGLIQGSVPENPVELSGLRFKNRVGVAAGLDKNGKNLKALAAMGFGHIEVGTVTPKPQPGNPKPRIFRLPKDKALINRMGFPSEGAEAVARRLEKRPNGVVIGVNIGKNRETPLDRAHEDYVGCFRTLFDVADYFTVNVSSPNTPGLRELQQRDHLDRLLRSIQQLNHQVPKPKPVLLKVSPDLTDGALFEIVEVAKANGINGFVATNTTISRDALRTEMRRVDRLGEGGLSGPPLRLKSLHVIGQLAGSGLPVIACGGLSTPEDAAVAMNAGATLLQVYTGLIYHGPRVVQQLA
jgi:dihydroorotate dehydrogenase